MDYEAGFVDTGHRGEFERDREPDSKILKDGVVDVS